MVILSLMSTDVYKAMRPCILDAWRLSCHILQLTECISIITFNFGTYLCFAAGSVTSWSMYFFYKENRTWLIHQVVVYHSFEQWSNSNKCSIENKLNSCLPWIKHELCFEAVFMIIWLQASVECIITFSALYYYAISCSLLVPRKLHTSKMLKKRIAFPGNWNC